MAPPNATKPTTRRQDTLRFAIAIILIFLLCGLSVLLVWKNAELIHGLGTLMAVVVMVVAALLATAILSGLLGAAGVWHTRQGTITGAGAVCLSLIAAELTAYRVVGSDEPWKLIGRIDQMPRGTSVEVIVNGTAGPCRAPVDPATTLFQIPIRKDCDGESLEIQIQPSGLGSYTHQVLRKDASRTQTIIKWKAIPTSITGKVMELGGTPAARALVKLMGANCDAQAETKTDDGNFEINLVGKNCGDAPFPVRVTYNGRDTDFNLSKLQGNTLVVPIVIRTKAVTRSRGLVQVELVGTLTLDDSPYFRVGSGLWVPDPQAPNKGQFLGDQTVRKGDEVTVTALSAEGAEVLLNSFMRVTPTELEALHERLPEFAAPVDLLVREYARQASAYNAAYDCAQLIRQLAVVKRGMQLRSTDARLVRIKTRNDELRQIAGCSAS